MTPCAAPAPWSPARPHAVGGLVQVGYATGRDLVLVHSHDGRGVFDALTGLRVARDDGDCWDAFDEGSLTVEGIGALAGERVRVAGLFGGALPRATADGFALDEVVVRGRTRGVVLLGPGSRTLVADEGVCELRAYGFSETGQSFVVATTCDLMLFARARVAAA